MESQSFRKAVVVNHLCIPIFSLMDTAVETKIGACRILRNVSLVYVKIIRNSTERESLKYGRRFFLQ